MRKASELFHGIEKIDVLGYQVTKRWRVEEAKWVGGALSSKANGLFFHFHLSKGWFFDCFAHGRLPISFLV